MKYPQVSASIRTHHDALSIGFLLLAMYLLTLSGHLYSPDEEAMLYVTQALAQGSGVAIPEGDVVAMPLRAGLDNKYYSPYGILPSLLAIPLYGIGSIAAANGSVALHDYLTRFAVSALNAPITALTAALLLRFVRVLGYQRRTAWLTALAYGLGSFAWPYAHTFFSEPLAGLLLLLAVERAYVAQQTGARTALLFSGLATGLLIPTRVAELIVLPLLGLYLALANLPNGQRLHTGRLFIWFVGLIPGFMLFGWYNLARFGTPFASGYADEAEAFSTPLVQGLYGLLFSPGKSLWLYAPPALLGIVGAVLMWRRWRSEVLLLVALVAAHIVLYAQWHAWEGGGVWGPRLLLPIVALLLVLAAPVFEWVLSTRQLLGKIGISLLLAFGLINALAGVLVHPGAYINSVGGNRRVYVAADSPLIGHWRMLADRITAHFGGEQCMLGDGYYSREALPFVVPRYTAANAFLRCTAQNGTQLELTINDARPAGAPASTAILELGTQPIALRSNQISRVFILIPPNTPIHLQNTTWNPASIGSQRDAEVGMLLVTVRATNGLQVLPVREATIEPTPASPRLRWGWYYVPHNQHLVDLWPWFLARSEASQRRQIAIGVAIIVSSIVCVSLGFWMLRRSRMLE